MRASRHLRAFFLALSIGAPSASFGATPSFNCIRATAPVEKLICADDRLARLDTQLNSLYEKRRDALAGASRSAFIKSQHEWLSRRNSCYAPSPPEARKCVAASMLGRIAELKPSSADGNQGQAKPSFNCTEAKAPIEKLICADNELARLDVQLNSVYEKTRDAFAGTSRSAFIKSQQEWLSRRNSCNGLAASEMTKCLAGSMQRRIAELNGSLPRESLSQTPVGPAKERAGQSLATNEKFAARSSNVALDFLNDYVPTVCNFSVPSFQTNNVGDISVHCKFSIDAPGRLRIESRETHSGSHYNTSETSEVSLGDLNPSDVRIGANPGFSDFYVGLYCTNRRKCAKTYYYVESASFTIDSDVVFIQVRHEEEAAKLVKAFSAAIRQFGGKESPF
jgi:uncharacterized protein